MKEDKIYTKEFFNNNNNSNSIIIRSTGNIVFVLRIIDHISLTTVNVSFFGIGSALFLFNHVTQNFMFMFLSFHLSA